MINRTECLAICLYTVALVVCVHGNTNSNELVTNTSTQQTDVERVRDYRLALIEQFFQGARHCNHDERHVKQFYCPTPHSEEAGVKVYRCIPMMQLCNRIPDCPGAEDEDLFACMFFEATNHQLKRLHTIVAQLILRSRNNEHDNSDLAALLRRRRRKRAVNTNPTDAHPNNRTVSTTSTSNPLDAVDTDDDDAIRLAMYNRLLLRKYALMPLS